MGESRGRVLTMGLVAINGLLALALWWLLRPQAPDTPPAASAAPPAAFQLPADPLPQPPASSFQELAERPLFWPERRADEVPAEPAGNAVAVSTLTLLGVAITPGDQQAMLRKQGDPQVLYARAGDVVEGWTVESIEPKRVVLNRGGTQAEVLLDEQETKPSAGAPRRAGVYRPQ